MNADQALFYHLAAALAVGLLVGVERGWEGRDVQDGQRGESGHCLRHR